MAVTVVAAAAACVVGGALGAMRSVGVEPDVRMWAEAGAERGAVQKAAKSERRVEFVPGQTAEGTPALNAVFVSVAVEPAPAVTAKSEADELAATAVGITA